MGTKKERTEAEDTRELPCARSREREKVVGVERRNQVIEKEISRRREKERDVYIERERETV